MPSRMSILKVWKLQKLECHSNHRMCFQRLIFYGQLIGKLYVFRAFKEQDLPSRGEIVSSFNQDIMIKGSLVYRYQLHEERAMLRVGNSYGCEFAKDETGLLVYVQ